MLIAGNPQIARIANVRAKLDLVVALNLRPVIDELELVFLLNQRTIAAVDSQPIAKVAESASLADLADILPIPARLPHEKCRLIGRKSIKVQTRNPDGCRRVCAFTVGGNTDVVPDVSKPKIRQHR